MADGRPRQLLPQSGKLGISRPLPPRSRSRGTPAPDSDIEGPARGKDVTSDKLASTDQQDEQIPVFDQSTDASNVPATALEATGTASLTPTPFQRSVSSSSVRSVKASSDQHAVQNISKEEIEQALQGLDRDDLVVALGRAKTQMDEIEARLEDQILENETLRTSSAALSHQLSQSERDAQALQMSVKQREDRIDEMMSDQDRMEGEVYSTMQVIERLRKQLAESEKHRNDAERRYQDQAATTDKERQHYADAEQLLKSQKATQALAYDKLLSNHGELLKAHERITNKLAMIQSSSSFSPASKDGESNADAEASIPTKPKNDKLASLKDNDNLVVEGVEMEWSSSGTGDLRPLSDETELTNLRDELLSTQKSLASLSETVAVLRTELKDVRLENNSLREENETFVNILQEKTLSGALLSESAMLRGLRASSGQIKSANGLLEPYDSDDGRSTSTDSGGETDGLSSASALERDDVPDTPKAAVNKTSRRQRKKSDSFRGCPSDLASELSQLDSASPRISRQNKVSNDDLPTNLNELQSEVRELREANQALTTYISKIIDRIIAKEGYENILAVESKGNTLRTLRNSRRKASRADLQSMFEPPAIAPEVADISNTSTASSGASGSFFGFGGGSSSQATFVSEKDASTKPKTKRGASIDWRNIPFLGGGTNTNAGSTTSLRPLTLQSDSLTMPISEGNARKVRISEEVEDEHDIAERERIREELESQGLNAPDNQLNPTGSRKVRPTSLASSSANTGGFAAFFSRVVGNGPGSLLSSARSDTMPQAPSTPGHGTEQEIDPRYSSTPSDIERRRMERNRALYLSTGGAVSSLTNHSGNHGIASRARQFRAQRQQQSLDEAAELSSSDAQTRSGLTSADGSTLSETSVAGDESYFLPTHLRSFSPSPANEVAGPSILGYNNPLPPLPHETTGDEDPDEYRSPTHSHQFLGSSQDQRWKKAFRRISMLSSSSNQGDETGSTAPSVASPTSQHPGGDSVQSPSGMFDNVPLSPSTASEQAMS